MSNDQTSDSNSHFPEFQNILKDNQFGTRFNVITTSQGNLVWGGASSLVYKDFKRHHLRGKDLKFKTYNQTVKKTLVGLMYNPFSKSNIQQSAIYVKSGKGKQAARLINKQVLQKFPSKTTPALGEDIGDNDFISYAYLNKALTYVHQFQRLPGILWFGDSLPGEKERDPYMVEAFAAVTPECLSQIKIIEHTNRQNFFIGLKAKQQTKTIVSDSERSRFQNQATFWQRIIRWFTKQVIENYSNNSADVIYILSFDKQSEITIDEVVQKVMKAQSQKPIGQRPSNEHLVQFSMPVIDLDVKHQHDEFKGLQISNSQLRGQKLKMVQNIKLRMDEKGVVVENDAFMGKDECAISGNIQINIQNPFWLVLTQQGKYPYLVTKINYLPQKHIQEMW